jgi:hypothetical protein
VAARQPGAARETFSEVLVVRARSIGLVCVAALLAACVYLPRTTQVYDDDCRILAKQMTLDLHQAGVFSTGCSNQGCAALLVTFGAVAMASAVVSGSIVIAGNIVYWFEKRGHCQPQPAS